MRWTRLADLNAQSACPGRRLRNRMNSRNLLRAARSSVPGRGLRPAAAWVQPLMDGGARHERQLVRHDCLTAEQWLLRRRASLGLVIDCLCPKVDSILDHSGPCGGRDP